jgi:DNA-binding PadR family transcriptional regulator
MPSPQSQQQYDKRFKYATLDFCDLMIQIGSPEVRVAAFLFKNTICFKEYYTHKRLALDEFVNGRKKTDGKRAGEGAGFKDPANVRRALNNLQTQGYLTVERDERDGARKQRFYRLTLPSLTKEGDVVSQDYKESEDEITRPMIVVSQDYKTQTEEDANVVPQDYTIKSPKTTQTSPPRLVDQSSNSSRDSYPKLKDVVPTSSVQSTLPEQEDDAKMLELDRLKRDLANAKKWGGTMSRQRDLERQIRTLQAEMQAEKESRSKPSHSQPQTQANTSEPAPAAGLYETEQATKQEPKALLPLELPEWTIADWRRDLESAERALERFQSMPADMEPEKVAFRIESIQQKIVNTKRTIAEMESGVTPPEPEPEPEQPKESMFSAVAHALGYPDTKRLNEDARKVIGKAVRQFEQVEIPVEQVGAVVSRYKRENRNFNIWAFLGELPKFAPMGGM